jgi:AraC-like DNA-binding protein
VEFYTVGAANVRALLGSLSVLGLDVGDLARQVALDVSALDSPDARVSEVQVVALWLAAERSWGRELLGLHAGASTPPQALEVLDHVTSCAPTVAEAFRRLARYFRIANTGMRFVIDETGDDVVMSLAHPYALELMPTGFVEYLWTVISTRLCRDNGQRVRATIAFRHEPQGERETYRRILGATIFGAAQPGLRIPRDQWNLKNDRADAALSSALEREAFDRIARLPRSPRLLTRVRFAIGESLRGGQVGIEDTAPRVGLSIRSLQRALAEEGYTYTRALDEVRHALAFAFLYSRIPSLSEVAYLLGFSEPRAFNRAFRRWTGKTPLELRTELWAARDPELVIRRHLVEDQRGYLIGSELWQPVSLPSEHL